MAQQRTRSKARKRQSQRRLPSTRTARAAHNRKQDLRAKRRRRETDEAMVVAKIGATPKRVAKGGRPRSRRLRKRTAA